MPKATMYEQRRPIFGENNIGCARQIFPMQAKSQPEVMQQPSNDHLRPSILSGHGPHDVAARFYHTVLLIKVCRGLGRFQRRLLSPVDNENKTPDALQPCTGLLSEPVAGIPLSCSSR